MLNADAVLAMPSTASPFNQNLRVEYVEIARAEYRRFDMAEAQYFLKRAFNAAKGLYVVPSRVRERKLPAETAAEMVVGREQLMLLLNLQGAATRAPKTGAYAQSRFDCWLYKSEETREDNQAEICRDEFFVALEALKPLPPPAPPPPPKPKPTNLIVLLPGADGTVGEITIKSNTGTQVLNRPGAATKLYEDSMTPPAQTFRMEVKEIRNLFGEALQAQPKASLEFLMYFKIDSDELTAQSLTELPEMLATISARPVPEITIIGHADRAGTDAYNERLSLRRAQVIRTAIINSGAKAKSVDIQARGESEPAVETLDGVSELRNRRVRVQVR